jgi:hypothetical protein
MGLLSVSARPLPGAASRLLVAVLLALCALGTLAVQGASADISSYAQSASGMSVPTGSINWGFDATACAVTDSCVTVGSYTDSSSQNSPYVIPITDGVPGAGATVTLPANAATNHQNAYLYDVACQSGNVCTAVGFYTDQSGATQSMVVQITDGSVGKAVELPVPANALAGTSVYAYGVGCPASGACFAVGYYQTGTHSYLPLVVPLNDGVPGTPQSPALPAGSDSTPDGEFESIACQSPTACVAVGFYANSGDEDVPIVAPIASGVAGTSVAVLPADADSSDDAYLNDVACPVSGSCQAIGYYYNSAGDEENMVVPITNGTPGTATGVAPPPDYYSDQSYVSLDGLSCSSASLCVAAGYYENAAKTDMAVLITVTSAGGAPAVVTLPANAGQSGQDAAFYGAAGVSCLPSGPCLAAGYYTTGSENFSGMLAETTASDQVDAAVATPAPSDLNSTNQYGSGPSSYLEYGIGCDGAESCVAIGEYYTTGHAWEPYEVTLQAPLSVATTSLPVGTKGSAYQTTLSAAGAWGNYSWAVSSGSLPAGLVLNSQTGVISGTPTAAGTTSFTLKVTGTGTPVPAATQTLTVTVAALPDVVVLSHSGLVQRARLGVKLGCSGAACSGTVKLEMTKVVTVKHGKKRVRKHETVVIGTASYSVAAGASKTLTVKLTGAGRSALAKAKKHHLAVTVIATVKGGSNASRHETIFTKSKRKKR